MAVVSVVSSLTTNFILTRGVLHFCRKNTLTHGHAPRLLFQPFRSLCSMHVPAGRAGGVASPGVLDYSRRAQLGPVGGTDACTIDSSSPVFGMLFNHMCVSAASRLTLDFVGIDLIGWIACVESRLGFLAHHASFVGDLSRLRFA